MHSNYSWALPYIDDTDVGLVCEIGSRDGLDSIYLSDLFGSMVYCFECDPINYEVAKLNLTNHGSKVELFKYALGDINGPMKFYSIDPLKYSNRGASSLFRIDFSNRAVSDPDFGKSEVQTECTVDMRRFDSLGLLSPDLIVMDVEGSELMVLRGFSTSLNEVKYIVTECAVSPGNSGRSGFLEVRRYLKKFGFRCVGIEGSKWLNLGLKIFGFNEVTLKFLTGKREVEVNVAFRK